MIIYTDGSCLGNPGPGGWAWYDPVSGRSSGGSEPNTTNNRMELTAIIKAMQIPNVDTIITDSNYCKKGIEDWSEGWKKRNWTLASGQPVKNADLWKIVISLKRNIIIQWVKAHAQNPHNRFVDLLARNEALSLKNNKQL